MNNLDGEFNQFKEEELQKSPKEIYDDHYKINFYEELYGFFYDTELSDSTLKKLSGSESVINDLYWFFLKYDYSSINTYEDTENLIENYIQCYLQGEKESDNGGSAM